MTQSNLPDTCTMLISLDLTIDHTIDHRTFLETDFPDGIEVSDVHWDQIETKTLNTPDILGKGGMGVVTTGLQTYPNRSVAIKKILRPSETYRRMLLQEAQIMGQLEHPNIVAVHQILRDEDGELMVVMKEIKGSTLQEVLDKEYTSGDPRHLVSLLPILIQVCFALEYSHSQSIVHRDIKCENIMIGDFNEVLLMDWGLAFNKDTLKGTQVGVVGTPSYLAPEMLSGKPKDFDIRSDTYLLGATLHHILMKEARHSRPTVVEALTAAQASEPFKYPHYIPSIFGKIANKACHKDPDERYQTVGCFRQALEDAVQHWEAIKILQTAAKDTHPLVQSIKDQDELSKVQGEFIQVRSLIETAMKMWPENPNVSSQLDSVLHHMVNYHIGRSEYLIADSLFAEISVPSEDLKKQLQLSRKEHIHLSEAHSIAQDYNPMNSKHGRKSLIVSLVAASVLLTFFAGTYSYFVTPEVTTTRLVITGSVVFFASILGAFIGRKTLLTNKLGKRMARTLVMSCGLMVANHVTGHLNTSDVNGIMVIDIMIMSVCFAQLSEIVPSAYKIAMTTFLMGLISLYYPSATHLALLVSVLISTVWALLDWIREDAPEFRK